MGAKRPPTAASSEREPPWLCLPLVIWAIMDIIIASRMPAEESLAPAAAPAPEPDTIMASVGAHRLSSPMALAICS